MRLEGVKVEGTPPTTSQGGVVIVFEYSECQLSMVWPFIHRRRWFERRKARRFAGVWHWSATGLAISGESDWSVDHAINQLERMP